MHGFIKDIDAMAIENKDFRRVLYTAKSCQLVVMSLQPKDEVGMETHNLDQFFRVKEGSGEAILDGVPAEISEGIAIVVLAGTKNNIVNTGMNALRLSTIYSPPNHRDGVVHHTRADAVQDGEHVDGGTSEEDGATA